MAETAEAFFQNLIFCALLYMIHNIIKNNFCCLFYFLLIFYIHTHLEPEPEPDPEPDPDPYLSYNNKPIGINTANQHQIAANDLCFL